MIKLKSDLFKVVEIKKKTRADMFKDIKVGDIIQFSTGIEHNTKWSGGGGVYATMITIENVTQSIITHKSQSNLVNILNASFELDKVE